MNRHPFPSMTLAGYRFATIALLTAAIPLLSACTDADAPGGATTDEIAPGLELPYPSGVLAARALDPGTLEVRARIDGTPLEPVRVGDAWRLDAAVRPGESVRVEVDWLLPGDAGDLAIASWSDTLGPFSSPASIEIDPGAYVSGIDDPEGRFDEDDDGVSNLDELAAGRDPRSADVVDPTPDGSETSTEEGAPPGTDGERAPLSIAAFDPRAVGLPELDGRYTDIDVWGPNATFRTADGAFLRIVNQVFDADGEPDGTPEGHQWFAMHDGLSLYLFVVFERGVHTPFRDSPDDYRDDDMLHLFVDGDGSGGTVPDGVDDRHIVVPFVPLDGRAAPEPFEVVDGAPRALGIDIDAAACVCGRCACLVDNNETESAWEIRLPLEALNIDPGREFGFEIQIDQDLDSGARESRWAWARAPLTELPDDGAGIESPATFGRVVLEESSP